MSEAKIKTSNSKMFLQEHLPLAGKSTSASIPSRVHLHHPRNIYSNTSRYLLFYLKQRGKFSMSSKLCKYIFVSVDLSFLFFSQACLACKWNERKAAEETKFMRRPSGILNLRFHVHWVWEACTSFNLEWNCFNIQTIVYYERSFRTTCSFDYDREARRFSWQIYNFVVDFDWLDRKNLRL